MRKTKATVICITLGVILLMLTLGAPAVSAFESTTDPAIEATTSVAEVTTTSSSATVTTTDISATSSTAPLTVETMPKAYIPKTPDFEQVNSELLEGFWKNCYFFFGTLLFALPLGLVIAFCTMSRFKIVRAITKTIVWCVRGTPLMLQVIVVFYGPGLLFDANILNRLDSAMLAFVINYACYFSEIYRGGIESIPKGQYEAGQVLGMTRPQIFRKIVLLQVVKRIVPPMSNEIITLIKDTSLVRVIAIPDIIHQAENFTPTGLIWPLFYTAIFFLIFCGALTLLFGFIEKKLSYFN